jgi:uncharacterized membrane protein YeaQ/YmgE (transglycosylase-associated protein family)
MRALLRWISVLGCAVLLAFLGAAGTHQKNFTLFLVAVLGAAVATVVVFVATATSDSA